MKKQTRTSNKRLIMSLVHYNGLTLASLGRRLSPPVSRSVVCRIVDPDHPDKPPHRLAEIAEQLHVPEEILFPFVSEDRENSGMSQHQR